MSKNSEGKRSSAESGKRNGKKANEANASKTKGKDSKRGKESTKDEASPFSEEELEKRQKEKQEMLDNMCLLDNNFFSAFLDNDIESVQAILNILLPDLQSDVVEVRTQVFVANPLEHSIQMDVRVVLRDRTTIDLEVQRDEDGADSHRGLYYYGTLITTLLPKGQDYKDMPNACVVFITETDTRGFGDPINEYISTCTNRNDQLVPNCRIIYVNGAYRGNDAIGDLMHDFACKKAADMKNPRLAEKMRYYKETKEGNKKMSEAIEKVLKRTESRMRIASARNAVNARLCSKRRAVEVFQLTPEEAAEFLAE